MSTKGKVHSAQGGFRQYITKNDRILDNSYFFHLCQQPQENHKDDQVTRCRFCDSKFYFKKNCFEFNKKQCSGVIVRKVIALL